MEVRTADEHPLTIKDIGIFKENFSIVKKEFFWFTTLLVFLIMFLFQRRNPNKERYWKKVVEESDKWAWLYRPLEIFDKFLLFLISPLKLLCWNVVVVSKDPILNKLGEFRSTKEK